MIKPFDCLHYFTRASGCSGNDRRALGRLARSPKVLGDLLLKKLLETREMAALKYRKGCGSRSKRWRFQRRQI